MGQAMSHGQQTPGDTRSHGKGQMDDVREGLPRLSCAVPMGASVTEPAGPFHQHYLKVLRVGMRSWGLWGLLCHCWTYKVMIMSRALTRSMDLDFPFLLYLT